MSPEKAVEFALTPKQLKALAPIIEAANRTDPFGPKFCVIAQVRLLPVFGPYTRATIRARLVDEKNFMMVKRALARAGLVEKKAIQDLAVKHGLLLPTNPVVVRSREPKGGE